MLRLLGTLLILAAFALVVALVMVGLLNFGGGAGGPQASSASASASASATAGASTAPGTVLVPQTVGLATPDAIDVASEAGLDWTVRCEQDPQEPEGVIHQEPPADTPVAPGSTFTMYSARVSDCR